MRYLQLQRYTEGAEGTPRERIEALEQASVQVLCFHCVKSMPPFRPVAITCCLPVFLPAHDLSLLAKVTAGHHEPVLPDDTVLAPGAPADTRGKDLDGTAAHPN